MFSCWKGKRGSLLLQTCDLFLFRTVWTSEADSGFCDQIIQNYVADHILKPQTLHLKYTSRANSSHLLKQHVSGSFNVGGLQRLGVTSWGPELKETANSGTLMLCQL